MVHSNSCYRHICGFRQTTYCCKRGATSTVYGLLMYHTFFIQHMVWVYTCKVYLGFWRTRHLSPFISKMQLVYWQRINQGFFFSIFLHKNHWLQFLKFHKLPWCLTKYLVFNFDFGLVVREDSQFRYVDLGFGRL